MSKKSKQIAYQLTQQAIKAVNKQLYKGDISIPQQNDKSQFPFISKSRVEKQDQKQAQKLHTILKKRKLLQDQLKKLRYDQQVAKQKIPHPMKQNQQGKTRYFRSSLTPEQKAKIKNIIKQTKRFQAVSAKKTNQLVEKIKKLQEQEEQMRKIIIKSKAQQNKREAEKKLKEIQARKMQRTKQIQKNNRQFQRVSKIKFLHQQLQQKWKTAKKTQQQQNGLLLQNNRKQKKFKIEQIKQHARKYSQIANNFKQKRQISSQKLKQYLLEHSRTVKFSHSTFFKTITQEQRQRRQLEAEKQELNERLNEKKMKYAQTVRQKNKSNFNPQNSSKIQSEPQTDIRTSRSLDNLGLNKLGNQYMKKIHTYIKGVQEMPINKKSNLLNKKQQNEVFKYPDYLTKARSQRKQKNPQQQPIQIKELNSIISKKNQNEDLKFYKAKLLVNKMDQNNKKNSKNLVHTIMAKLALIEQFTQSA